MLYFIIQITFLVGGESVPLPKMSVASKRPAPKSDTSSSSDAEAPKKPAAKISAPSINSSPPKPPVQPAKVLKLNKGRNSDLSTTSSSDSEEESKKPAAKKMTPLVTSSPSKPSVQPVKVVQQPNKTRNAAGDDSDSSTSSDDAEASKMPVAKKPTPLITSSPPKPPVQSAKQMVQPNKSRHPVDEDSDSSSDSADAPKKLAIKKPTPIINSSTPKPPMQPVKQVLQPNKSQNPVDEDSDDSTSSSLGTKKSSAPAPKIVAPKTPNLSMIKASKAEPASSESGDENEALPSISEKKSKKKKQPQVVVVEQPAVLKKKKKNKKKRENQYE